RSCPRPRTNTFAASSTSQTARIPARRPHNHARRVSLHPHRGSILSAVSVLGAQLLSFSYPSRCQKRLGGAAPRDGDINCRRYPIWNDKLHAPHHKDRDTKRPPAHLRESPGCILTA
ncbi:hypothetical protein K438DRAFT_1949740, partial [Mycena galopus ATCC 62051]